MAGGTPTHSLIGNNIGDELRRVLKNRPCNALTIATLKLQSTKKNIAMLMPR